MKRYCLAWFPFIFFCLIATGFSEVVQRDWKVEGVAREALFYLPDFTKEKSASVKLAPVVFAFHGHGGTMKQAARSFQIHKAWPQAITVYMQGLKTPGQLTDPNGKRPGWQSFAGDQKDRDLKFFDVVLATLRKEYQVDPRRIYAMGHSNGGGFTYLLWAERGEVFAAYAPSGAVAVRSLWKLKPSPVLHVLGERDGLVKYSWQRGMLNALHKLNSTGEGKPWHDVKWGIRFPGRGGNDLVEYKHPGGHEFPVAAGEAMVRFFKEH